MNANRHWAHIEALSEREHGARCLGRTAGDPLCTCGVTAEYLATGRAPEWTTTTTAQVEPQTDADRIVAEIAALRRDLRAVAEGFTRDIGLAVLLLSVAMAVVAIYVTHL